MKKILLALALALAPSLVRPGDFVTNPSNDLYPDLEQGVLCPYAVSNPKKCWTAAKGNAVKGALKDLRDQAGALAITAPGSSTARALADRFADRANVLDFIPANLHASIRDGTNTSPLQAYIQAAATAACVSGSRAVYLPPGSYLVAASITAPCDGLTAEGVPGVVSYYTSGIYPPSTFVAAPTFPASTAVLDFRNHKSTTVRHLGFKLGSTSAYGIEVGVRTGGTTYNVHEFTGNHIVGGAVGLRCRNAGLLKVKGNNFSGPPDASATSTGVWLEAYCGDSDFEGNYFNSYGWTATTGTNAGGAGLYVGYGSSNVNIRGGKVEWNAKGIYVFNSQGVTITGVNFDYNTWRSITVQDDGSDATVAARSINIVGNRFLAGGLSGISQGASQVYVTATGSASIIVNLTGNTFRKGGDAAYDQNVQGSIGPASCVSLNSPALPGGTATVRFNAVGNDMHDGALTNSFSAYGNGISVFDLGNMKNLGDYIDAASGAKRYGVTVTAAGDVQTHGGFSPGTMAGATQANRIFFGSGVPSNGSGSNSDFYFRTDTPGSANQRLYVKSAGAWVGIL